MTFDTAGNVAVVPRSLGAECIFCWVSRSTNFFRRYPDFVVVEPADFTGAPKIAVSSIKRRRRRPNETSTGSAGTCRPTDRPTGRPSAKLEQSHPPEILIFVGGDNSTRYD